MIWDRAGFHPTEAEEKLPERLPLLPLPPYSPELNPVEGLWDQVKDGLCNRLFATFDELEVASGRNVASVLGEHPTSLVAGVRLAPRSSKRFVMKESTEKQC